MKKIIQSAFLLFSLVILGCNSSSMGRVKASISSVAKSCSLIGEQQCADVAYLQVSPNNADLQNNATHLPAYTWDSKMLIF